eukprot:6402436-Alexandrium_andersonii.AAC.1
MRGRSVSLVSHRLRQPVRLVIHGVAINRRGRELKAILNCMFAMFRTRSVTDGVCNHAALTCGRRPALRIAC